MTWCNRKRNVAAVRHPLAEPGPHRKCILGDVGDHDDHKDVGYRDRGQLPRHDETQSKEQAELHNAAAKYHFRDRMRRNQTFVPRSEITCPSPFPRPLREESTSWLTVVGRTIRQCSKRSSRSIRATKCDPHACNLLVLDTVPAGSPERGWLRVFNRCLGAHPATSFPMTRFLDAVATSLENAVQYRQAEDPADSRHTNIETSHR